jgi:hypothetical protein
LASCFVNESCNLNLQFLNVVKYAYIVVFCHLFDLIVESHGEQLVLVINLLTCRLDLKVNFFDFSLLFLLHLRHEFCLLLEVGIFGDFILIGEFFECLLNEEDVLFEFGLHFFEYLISW